MFFIITLKVFKKIIRLLMLNNLFKVCINGDKSKTFALKALKKKHIVDTRQQEHIFAERNIMMETRSEWIVK